MPAAELKNGVKVFYAKNRKAFRSWLEKNHAKEKSVWLVLYNKSSATKSISYVEAVEEALCFGWIDSKPNKRDPESRYQYFTKRKPTGVWSSINKERIEKLAEKGLMTEAGLAAIEQAKKNGSWNALDKIDKIEIPKDLEDALAKNKKATGNFNTFAPSSKKIILSWIYNAKRTETRKQRVAETVKLAARGIKANHYRPKQDG
jgi:uncharacterized protein YdeI (YjbR/CyaY-like superfamily)